MLLAVGILSLPVVWFVLGGIATIGLLAIVSPLRFMTLTSRTSRWIDTDSILESLNRRIDLDHYVLPFSRALGIAVVGSVAIIVALLARFTT